LKKTRKIQSLIRTTAEIMIIIMLSITGFSVLIGMFINPTITEDLEIAIDNPLETYTFLPMHLNRMTIAEHYVVFNNTGFNITTDEPINIGIKHIDENIYSPDGTDDLLLSFGVTNLMGNYSWFNLSGFYPGDNYTIEKDYVTWGHRTANSTGVISFYDLPSWNGVCDIYWSYANNTAPTLSNVYPANHSVDVSCAGDHINIKAVDLEGDLMRTDVWTNASGTWTQVAGWDVFSVDNTNYSRRFLINYDNPLWNYQDASRYWAMEGWQENGTRYFVEGGVCNGEVNFSVTDDWGMTTPLTQYWWSVNCTDNTSWTNHTYSFTTDINYPPNISNPFPADGAVDVDVTGSPVNAKIVDPDGDDMQAEIWSNYTGSWVKYSGYGMPGGYEDWFILDVNGDGMFQEFATYMNNEGWQGNGTRGHYDSAPDYNMSVTDEWGMMTPNTQYWWQVRADDGNDTTIRTFSFTTGASPDVVVRTNTTTNVEERTATFNGYLKTDDLGSGCNVSFQYWVWSFPNSKSETTNQTKNEGDTFEHDIIYPPGISPGTIYRYRSVADNSLIIVYGNNITFITKPYPPQNLAISYIPGGNRLDWDLPGGNSNSTVVVYNTNHTPTSLSDGIVVYNSSHGLPSTDYYEHTGLTTGLTYYYSLWSLSYLLPEYKYSDSYISGSRYYIDSPSVTTNESTSITTDSAILWGFLSDNGGEECTVRFEYGLTTAYGANTTNQIKTTGDTFSESIPPPSEGLTEGTLYHYRAYAENTIGIDQGSDIAFLSLPDSPIILHINNSYSPSTLNITWTVGSGANKTYIERDTTASSWSRGEGTNVFNGTGTYYNDTGLETGVTYYYQAWSYTNWTDNSTTYWQYSSTYDDASNTTQTVDPPYNGSSVYDTNNFRVNLTWTSGNLSDYDVVVQNNNSYPSSPSDGWVRQNSTVNSSNYFNGSIDYGAYFTVWSYNLTGNIYSSTGLNIPWGALGMQCYDEATGLPLMYDVLITNSDLDTLNLVNIGNIYYLDMTTIPYGTNTVFYVSSDGYESRIYLYDMELNNFYNLTFYLPLAIPAGEGGDPGGGGDGGQDCVTRTYTDSVTITNPAVDAVITLTHVLDEMIDVHIYNDELYGTYGGWFPVPTDKFSFTSSTVTIDKSVLFANSTIGRVQYYYEDCGDYDPSNHTYSHLYRFIVINEIDQTLEGVKLQVLKYLNFTEDWEEVSILLTDANGQADVYLLAGSGLFYKIKASKTDYTTQTIDFIPDTNYYGVYYPKTIRLIREEIEIPDIVTGFDIITWDAYFISGDNTTLYIDYLDSTGNTTIGNIKVYRNGTYLNYTYNFTSSSFSITFDYANHSLYDYKVMLNITGHPDITSGNYSDIRIVERYRTPDESMFDFSWALELDFVEVLGENPLGWVNLVVLFLGLVIMLAVGKAWAGIGIIGLGAILFIVQRVIGLPGFTLVQLAVIPFFMLFGLLVIIAKNKKDVRF